MQLRQLQHTADAMAMTLAELAYRMELQNNPRYAETRRVVQFGWKSFSQNDEDGILTECYGVLGRVPGDSSNWVSAMG